MSKKKLLIVALLVALVLAFFAFDLGRFLSLAYLKSQQASFATLYAQSPAAVIGAYALIYIVVFALALPVGAVMTLAGGALFGLVVGTIVVSFASTIGAVLAFLASRYVLGHSVRQRLGQRLAEVDKGIDKDGAFYLFTLRLIPAIPPAAINLLFGLTKMRTWTFYWVSQLGMFAGTDPAARRRHAGAVQRLGAGAHDRQGDHSLRVLRLRLADDRLERDARDLVGELLLLEEIEQRRITVDGGFVEIAADGDAALSGDGAHVLDDLVERALAAPQRTHPVVRIVVAVERDLHGIQPIRGQPIDDLRGEEQSVRDHVDEHPDAARLRCLPEPLGEVIRDRQVQQRFTPEQGEHEAFGKDGVEPLLRPLRDARRGLERHLRGRLVVFPMVALEAVVARKIALERRQHRHAQLVGVLADVAEPLRDVLALGVAVVNDEPMLGEREQRVPLDGGQGACFGAGQAVQQRRNVARDDQLRIGERVHQEHVVLPAHGIERHADVEHRRLHSRSLIAEPETAH